MNEMRSGDPRLAAFLGFVLMGSGASAAFACIYGAFTGSWPLAAIYLFGIFGGASAFVMGLRFVREAFGRPKDSDQ